MCDYRGPHMDSIRFARRRRRVFAFFFTRLRHPVRRQMKQREPHRRRAIKRRRGPAAKINQRTAIATTAQGAEVIRLVLEDVAAASGGLIDESPRYRHGRCGHLSLATIEFRLNGTPRCLQTAPVPFWNDDILDVKETTTNGRFGLKDTGQNQQP